MPQIEFREGRNKSASNFCPEVFPPFLSLGEKSSFSTFWTVTSPFLSRIFPVQNIDSSRQLSPKSNVQFLSPEEESISPSFRAGGGSGKWRMSLSSNFWQGRSTVICRLTENVKDRKQRSEVEAITFFQRSCFRCLTSHYCDRRIDKYILLQYT